MMMSSEPVQPVKKVWLPTSTRATAAFVRAVKAFIVIMGPSGAGKSHLVRQLALLPEYKGRVVVLMSEDATSTYGDDLITSGAIHIIRVTNFKEAEDRVNEFVAARLGPDEVMPVIFYDSLSGTG